MPTFDGTNLVIILDSGVTSVDVGNDLYSNWKEWILISDNAKYPPAFRVVGGDALSPGITAGAYFFLQNQDGWRIRPPEEDITIYLVGNLAAETTEEAVAVPTVGAFTAALIGLQPVTQNVGALLTLQQESSYNGAVHIDTVNGDTGTAYPVGTASHPALTLAAGLTIAMALGIEDLVIHGSVTLTTDYANYQFMSGGAGGTVNINGRNVAGCMFQGLTLTGSFAGIIGAPARYTNCRFYNATSVVGIATSCTLATDTSVGTGFFALSMGTSSAGGTTNYKINFQGLNCNCVVRGFYGGLEVTNMTHASSYFTAEFDVGRCVLAASCTAGNVILAGTASLADNSAGTTVTSNQLLRVNVLNGRTGLIPSLV